ncbi:C45 family autoproteolytic acyltransferase/hydolase [Helicobacter suis]|uniref:C45 family autoproteolytic acyltransferase/hydolase n=1 Tax=Helicobacter suis TaxID=104628 RepID=UPI00196823EC|nr:C45 family peptidase [Helicobacter suis]
MECSIQTYKTMFLDYSNIKWEDALKYASSFIPSIKAYDSAYLEEIKGLAEGSGFLLEEILALNTRSEIVLQGKQVITDGCTTFALTPDLSASGRVLLGQNWDWKTSIKDALILLHLKQENKPSISMVTEAGIIGKIGLNSAGVGVCLNALASDARIEGKTIPLHIALRGILDSFTLKCAIRAATSVNLACCAHFMLADKRGEAISLEVGPACHDAFYADEDFHTNHFISPRLNHFKDTTRCALPDTYQRLGRMKKLIKNLKRKVSIEDMQRFLGDTISYPDSICRFDDLREAEAKRMSTVFSMIMDLSREEFYLAPGTPINTAYSLVRF